MIRLSTLFKEFIVKILLATNNLNKILEIKTILKPEFRDVDFYSLRDFPDYTALPEDGSSFTEIAETKALHAATAINMPAISDDSGLVIPYLQGAPGIYSARYTGEGATDKENRQKVLKELADATADQRNAYMVACISFAIPEKTIKTVEGFCEGVVTLEDHGSQGFGCDSIFMKHDYNKTMAELDQDTKNKISHRRKALDKILPVLKDHLCPTMS